MKLPKAPTELPKTPEKYRKCKVWDDGDAQEIYINQ
jgi:hypothetical protein